MGRSPSGNAVFRDGLRSEPASSLPIITSFCGFTVDAVCAPDNWRRTSSAESLPLTKRISIVDCVEDRETPPSYLTFLIQLKMQASLQYPANVLYSSAAAELCYEVCLLPLAALGVLTESAVARNDTN
jgi:hypothetical protein